MAYHTNFHLYVAEGEKSVEEVLNILKTQHNDNEQFEDLFTALDDDGTSGNEVTWYEHEEDMIKISKLFPDHVFELYADGSALEDISKKFFLNGKIQVCPVPFEFDEFNPSLLKEKRNF